MSTIFYGMCGEGLGHCGRSLALIENLPQHQFVVFTYADACKYLQNLQIPNAQVVEINGLEFDEKNGRVQTLGTIKKALKFVWSGFSKNKKQVRELAAQMKPDLFLTDWEPTSPRMAAELDVPCVSIDSQHKFRFYAAGDLPLGLKAYSYATGLFCRMMVPKADHHIIATFQSDLIERKKGITLSQSLIRKQFADLPRVPGEHLLVYVRQEEIARKILDSILASDTPVCPIICYGVHLDSEYPQVTFKDLSYSGFALDLAHCKAVFSTAGTQLIGESRYYGKPICVVPIPAQHEQSINANHVNLLRLGVGVKMKEMGPQTVNQFLDTFGEGIPFSENGVNDAVKVVEHYLAKGK